MRTAPPNGSLTHGDVGFSISSVSKKPDLTRRSRLRPSQIWTVADRRFDDALALRKTKKNKHANGAIYLGGLTIDMIMKVKLIEAHAWLEAAASRQGRSGKNQRLWRLCYELHKPEEILAELPALEQRFLAEGDAGLRLLAKLRSVFAEWSIFVRYAPQTADMAQAADFLAKVKELKQWLRRKPGRAAS